MFLLSLRLGWADTSQVRLPITLEDAVLQALNRSTDIRLRRLEVEVNEQRLRLAWGDFDPSLNYNATRDWSETPQNAQEFVSTGGVAGPEYIFEQNNLRMAASLEGRLPLGTRLALSLRSDRYDNTLNRDPRARLFYPEHYSFAGVEIRQPLLRDFGFAANLAGVRLARKTKEISRLEWENQVVKDVATVLATYYEMQFADANLRVKEEAIAADRRLLEQNRRRFELGFMSPIDVRQAEVAVSFDEEEKLVAQNAFMESQFRLQRVIFGSREEAGNRVLEPVGVLKRLPMPCTAREELLRQAWEHRLDYHRALREIEVENIRVRYARNQVLPRVDLVATFGAAGMEQTYARSLDRAFSAHTPSWSVGVQASVPLGNVAGRAQLAAVKGLKEQAVLRLKQVELQIGIEVDTALSRLETNRQRVETAANSTRLALEALTIARRKLETGQISSFDVIEQQKKLYQARTRELQATAEFNIAVVQLQTATGMLLKEQGIRIEE